MSMPAPDSGCVLAANRGSSSLKFALYDLTPGPALGASIAGTIERIGQRDASLEVNDYKRGQRHSLALTASGHGEATGQLIDWLEETVGFGCVKAVGHRVVHGGPIYYQPELVTPELLAALREISPYDPDHLPTEIAMIEAFANRFPDLPQVACFDTAFHRQMPKIARLFPIPRKYDRRGIERYGFHGLSYAYLLEELRRRDGSRAEGRVVLAHLGAGASLAAVRGGRSIDTSMGFTPTAGLPMATRSGDLDPGLVSYLARTEQMTAQQFHDMVNHDSGMRGVSETTGDMKALLEKQATDERAADAVALFCYQAKKWIGAFAAALGGVEILVFSGGIGEHSPEIRRRICQGLEFLGILCDDSRNAANQAIISPETGGVTVYVLHTDEEQMIARATAAVLRGRDLQRNTESTSSRRF